MGQKEFIFQGERGRRANKVQPSCIVTVHWTKIDGDGGFSFKEANDSVRRRISRRFWLLTVRDLVDKGRVVILFAGTEGTKHRRVCGREKGLFFELKVHDGG